MNFQEIKKEFFSFRNGIVAKAFLDSGYPYRHIYGLQVPELGRIARECGMPDEEIAKSLWADRECRESRLLASWMFDTGKHTLETVKEIIGDVKTAEEADLLAFRFLKRLPFAEELLETDIPDTGLSGYTIEALRRNLA